MRERDVVQHLEHLARSLRGAGGVKQLEVEPAHCLACDFSFTTRERLGRPSRCPACKSERLEPPLFRLVGAAQGG
jgi:predicted Zn-ribbon and HTH transcriptional regulator